MIAFALKIIDFVPKAVYAGAVVLLFILFSINQLSLGKLRKENAAYEVAVEQCAKTNAQNKDVVEFLKLQNSQCLDARREDETRLANSAAAWEAERAALLERGQEVEIRNVEVYREPSCAELAQLDINAVCPDLANGLRRRAESYNRIRNDNGRSTGTDGTTGDPAN